MSRTFYLCFLICILTATGARAQNIKFTNGDQLSGKWLKVEGTTITYNSGALGSISIPTAKVAALDIEQPIVVVLQNGTVIHANSAKLAANSWTVAAQGGQQEIAAKDVGSIVPAAAYHAVVTTGQWKPWRGWKGNGTLGYSLQNGDQNTHTISVGMSAVRRQPNLSGVHERWRTTFGFNLLFASASSDGVTISSNTLTASLRQDYFLQPKNFLFVLGSADHIQTENLYLQQTYGGGYGRELLSSPRIHLSALIGASFENQKFVSVPAEQFADALIGENLTLTLNKHVHLENAFHFYPNLTARGQYRFDTASTLSFQLMKWLSANFGTTDFYISHIPPGSVSTVSTIGPGGTITSVSFPTHKNNITLTAGLGVNF